MRQGNTWTVTDSNINWRPKLLSFSDLNWYVRAIEPNVHFVYKICVYYFESMHIQVAHFISTFPVSGQHMPVVEIALSNKCRL